MLSAKRAQRVSRAFAISALLLTLLVGACEPQAGGVTPSPAGPTAAPPTISPPATPTPETPTPADSPPATPGPGTSPAPGEAWQYLANFPAGQAIEVSSVVARGNGFVAVGFEPVSGEDFGGRRNGVVWVSDDGLAWTRTAPAAFEYFAPLYIVSLDEVLYVFGDYSVCPEFSDEEECEDVADAGIAAWRSSDGASWQRLPIPESMRAAILDGVTVGLGRVLAFGATGDDLLGIVWSSPDGAQWNEMTELAGLSSIAVLGAGPERVVAFSAQYLAGEDDVETLVGHSDGGGFQPGQLPAGQRGTVESVAWGPSGFVAVGNVFRPAPAGIVAIVLVSADGVAWTQAGSSDLPPDASFRHVLTVPGGYLVIGSVPVEGEFGQEQASAWYSTGGLSWVEHGDLAGGDYRQLSSSAVGTGGAIVFATEFEEVDDEEPVDLSSGSVHAWFAPPATLP
jgi:hypothetical protein